MPPTGRFIPKGVIVAVLLPFDADYAIDEAATRSHLRDVAGVAGISALTVNGHSTEVHACSADEQMRLLDITMDEVGDRVPVVNGIYADGSCEAARIARMAEAGGAAALLVLPPHPIGRGNGNARPEMALAHFAAIAEATDLPIIVFQYPRASGYGYPMATLLRLAETIPSIAAIKDGCNDAKLHDSHVQVLQSLPRPVNVLSTHSPWLMQSLTTGMRRAAVGCGKRDRRPPGRAVRGDQGRRPYGRAADQRPDPTDIELLLRRSGLRHAQPDEGGAGAAGPVAARGGAPVVDEAFGRGDRRGRARHRRGRVSPGTAPCSKPPERSALGEVAELAGVVEPVGAGLDVRLQALPLVEIGARVAAEMGDDVACEQLQRAAQAGCVGPFVGGQHQPAEPAGLGLLVLDPGDRVLGRADDPIAPVDTGIRR